MLALQATELPLAGLAIVASCWSRSARASWQCGTGIDKCQLMVGGVQTRKNSNCLSTPPSDLNCVDSYLQASPKKKSGRLESRQLEIQRRRHGSRQFVRLPQTALPDSPGDGLELINAAATALKVDCCSRCPRVSQYSRASDGSVRARKIQIAGSPSGAGASARNALRTLLISGFHHLSRGTSQWRCPQSARGCRHSVPSREPTRHRPRQEPAHRPYFPPGGRYPYLRRPGTGRPGHHGMGPGRGAQCHCPIIGLPAG